MGLGGAGRDNADDFFVVLLIKLMNDEKNRARSDRSDRYPSFLVVEVLVTLRDCVWVVKNKNGSFKTNVVLAKLLPALAVVPLKSHSRSRPNSVPA